MSQLLQLVEDNRIGNTRQCQVSDTIKAMQSSVPENAAIQAIAVGDLRYLKVEVCFGPDVPGLTEGDEFSSCPGYATKIINGASDANWCEPQNQQHLNALRYMAAYNTVIDDWRDANGIAACGK